MSGVLPFKDQQEVEQRATIQLLDLLNDRNTLQPERLQAMIKHYQKQNELESKKIKMDIRSKIDSLEHVQAFIGESAESYNKMQAEMKQLALYFEENRQQIESLGSTNKLLAYRLNLQKVIGQMKYFKNIKKKLSNIQGLLDKNCLDDYEYINYKLMRLTALRNNRISESDCQLLKLSQAGSEPIQVQHEINDSLENPLQQEFQQLSQLNDRFLELLDNECASLLDTKSIKTVQTIQRLIDNADSAIETQLNSESVIYPSLFFISLCKKAMNRRVEQKFIKAYKGTQGDLGLVVKESEFVISDMVRALKYLHPGFLAKNNIFSFVQGLYKEKMIEAVAGCLHESQGMDESYGNLLALLQFIDKYEKHLERHSENKEHTRLTELKVMVKQFMPQFLEHLERLLENQIVNFVLEDRQRKQSLQAVKELIEQEQEVMSGFPVDVFKVINSQIEMVGNKLEGELFMEFIRIVQEQLQKMVGRMTEQLEEETEFYYDQMVGQKEQQVVSPLFKLVMDINNAQKCHQFAAQTKQLCISLQPVFASRVEFIFQQDLSQSFHRYITLAISKMQAFLFVEVEMQIFPLLFSQAWLEQRLLEIALSTLEDYMKDLRNTLCSVIHHNKVMKRALEYLVERYFMTLVAHCHNTLNICPSFQVPPRLLDLSPPAPQIIAVLTDRPKVISKVNEEITFFQEQLSQYDFISQQFQEEVLSRLKLFLSLLKSSKVELEAQFIQLRKAFADEMGEHLLEAVLQIREDCDKYFGQTLLKKYQSYRRQ